MSSVVNQAREPIGRLEFADEMMLLGTAMLAAQKFEFALYGMAAHLKDKAGAFKNLTPEEFLRGDGANTKATLGTIVSAFAPQFDMDGDELTQLVKDRNLIAHDYWRMTKSNITDGRKLENPEEFLFRFIERCDTWISRCQGWIHLAMTAVAHQVGRQDEVKDTPELSLKVQEYLSHLNDRPSSGSDAPTD